MTGFLGHLVPGSFESLGKIITPSLGIVLVALGVGAAVGPPHAAADAATRSRATAPAAPPGKAAAGAHRQATAKPPKEPTATPTVCSAAYERAARYVDARHRPVHQVSPAERHRDPRIA